MLTVCIPVLRRYDTLLGLILSIGKSTVKPDLICIIDNGRSPDRLKPVEDAIHPMTTLITHTPAVPMGVAESWNWFLANTDDDRVICNDDILLEPDSLEKLVACKADLVWGSGFSCFVIRDSCVEKLGTFDETISPGYGYYEDDDYLQRLDGRGTKPRTATAENVDCGVRHLHSMTLKAANHEEIMEHHRRFKIAQSNYMKKWGIASL